MRNLEEMNPFTLERNSHVEQESSRDEARDKSIEGVVENLLPSTEIELNFHCTTDRKHPKVVLYTMLHKQSHCGIGFMVINDEYIA